MTPEQEERIARYLDGEMTADEVAAFEQDLEQDAALAERCAAWADQDRAVAAAIDGLLSTRPMPAFAADAGVVDLAGKRQARRGVGSWRWAVPAALAAGIAVLMLASPLVMHESGDSTLGMLESLPAGQSVTLADGRSLDAVLTFAAADGRWCREYAVSDGSRGIACRSGGEWRAEVEVTGSTSEEADAQGYAMAGADEDAAIEEAYARLGGDIPLGVAEEHRVMQNGWTAPAQ